MKERGKRSSLVVLAMICFGAAAHAQPAGKKPKILILWGDDVGYWNVSAYNQGMMGYKTPNIDRVAREGALFTDYYGQQSGTAARAAFITGQCPFRTGLLKVESPPRQKAGSFSIDQVLDSLQTGAQGGGK